ncbi:hypothetical protein FXO38_01851 [Capsicum annuum]|nr:hypothetical protein FXO38_01851 [Capsicum annuum]
MSRLSILCHLQIAYTMVPPLGYAALVHPSARQKANNHQYLSFCAVSAFPSKRLAFISLPITRHAQACDFQGPALVVILEGANLSRDEVAGLQFLPPWGLRGDTMNYGLGLLSCFSISDFVSVVSDGFLYMFDPKGLALAMPSHRAPAAKMFSLRGTNLTERFRDQFSPLLIDQNVPWSLSNSTVIRMPFSLECMKDGLEFGLKKISMMLDKFLNNASATILFLKSVLQTQLERGPRHLDLTLIS